MDQKGDSVQHSGTATRGVILALSAALLASSFALAAVAPAGAEQVQSLTTSLLPEPANPLQPSSLSVTATPTSGSVTFSVRFPNPLPRSNLLMKVGVSSNSNLACIEQPIDLIPAIFGELPHRIALPQLGIDINLLANGGIEAKTYGYAHVRAVPAAVLEDERRSITVSVTDVALMNSEFACAFVSPLLGKGGELGAIQPAVFFPGKESQRRTLLERVHIKPMTTATAVGLAKSFLRKMGRAVVRCHLVGTYRAVCAFAGLDGGRVFYGSGRAEYVVGENGQSELTNVADDIYFLSG